MATSQTGSTAHDLVAALPDSPAAYPQKLDLLRASALLVRFDEHAYRDASFLDDRVLRPDTQGVWITLDRAIAAAGRVSCARPLHFILHTGHVGSTLISRLLESAEGVLSLREPLPLRTLAEAADRLGEKDSLLGAAQFDALLGAFIAFWRRGFASTHSVVLKATSSAARIAPQLLRHDPQARAIYLNLRAEPYLATLLAGPNSATDLRGHGPERMRRLVARLDAAALQPLHTLSQGELAAMSWLAESMTQREVLDQAGARVLAIDFDALLGDLSRVMASIAAHLALSVPAGWDTQLVSNPVLTRYSKSLEHEYSAGLRAQVLDQARREHANEIRRGLNWLQSLARAEPRVARVLDANG